MFRTRQNRVRQEFEREALPHLDALYGTAFRLTKNSKDAEDLTQDTLLKAFRFFHRFEHGTNIKAWLFKILHNSFYTRYRKVLSNRRLLDDATAEQGLDVLVSAEARDASRDPEGALVARLLSDEVSKALENVPETFRETIILSDIQEFTYKEIADILEVPVGTVMSRLFRGRRLLQKALFDYAAERGLIPSTAVDPKSVESELRGKEETIDLAQYRAKRQREGSH